jgi:23S rRNA pseudouridine2605 synthase
MLERLQKILSMAGVSSRREAERLITAGKVAVNGTVVTELGSKADPEKDRITLNGKPVRVREKKLYVLLYKPAGYMTTLKDPEGRPIVTDLVKSLKERVFPVGRLDYNTEGLLLLTNDGTWANRLAHPRHEVEKEYIVRIRGTVTEEQMAMLSKGVELDEDTTAPATVRPMRGSEGSSWISITIHEGRYRQVRRMCEAVGLSVVRLKRIRYGFLDLGTLRQGEYRLLSDEEAHRIAGGEGAPVLPQAVSERAGKAEPTQGKTRKEQAASGRQQSGAGRNDRKRH